MKIEKLQMEAQEQEGMSVDSAKIEQLGKKIE